MRERSLIIVEWDDISADNTWHGENDLGDCVPFPCRTVGWRMPSDKGILRVASTRCRENNKCADIVTIPRKNITNVRRLE